MAASWKDAFHVSLVLILASAAKKKKSESVSLKTFKKWSFGGDFKVETDEDNNITKITCKVCSDNFA